MYISKKWILALLALLAALFAMADNDRTLVWEAPTVNADGSELTDLAGYKVYRNGALVGGTVATEYADNNLVDGQYCYTVTAVDQSGNESVSSNEVCTVVDSMAPGAPGGLSFK